MFGEGRACGWRLMTSCQGEEVHLKKGFYCHFTRHMTHSLRSSSCRRLPCDQLCYDRPEQWSRIHYSCIRTSGEETAPFVIGHFRYESSTRSPVPDWRKASFGEKIRLHHTGKQSPTLCSGDSQPLSTRSPKGKWIMHGWETLIGLAANLYPMEYFCQVSDVKC